MATYSTLGIANKALARCGASPITALTDDTSNGRAINEAYETSKKSVLGECAWNFAVTRSSLVTSSVTQPWSYINENIVYDRPAGVIRIISTSDKDAIWREEGEYIMSDTLDLGIKYVYDVTDASKFQPLFVEAFIDKLCSDICFMILHSETKAIAFLEKYEKVSLDKAMSVNAQTGTQQSPNDDEWERAKYGNEGNPARSYD